MANDITRINAARSSTGAGVDTSGNKNANCRRNPNARTGTAIRKARQGSTGAQQQIPRKAKKPLNQKRVNTVRKAIARGNYSVDVERLADKLLDIDTSKD